MKINLTKEEEKKAQKRWDFVASGGRQNPENSPSIVVERVIVGIIWTQEPGLLWPCIVVNFIIILFLAQLTPLFDVEMPPTFLGYELW